MKTAHLITVFILTTLISACGFQLRGQASPNETIRAIYLDCTCGAHLKRSLIAQLQERGIALNNDPSDGLAVYLSEVEEQSFDIAVGADEQSKEVELTLSFNSRVERDGKILGEQRIEDSTFVRYNSNAYLASNMEAEETRARLQRDSADKLIRYIESVNNRH